MESTLPKPGAGAAGVQQPVAVPPGGLQPLAEVPEPADQGKVDGTKSENELPAGEGDGKMFSLDSSLSSSDSEDEGIGKKDKKKKKKKLKKKKKDSGSSSSSSSLLPPVALQTVTVR
ncbi:hypothetical protein PBY51_009464 [Eleginops maclovinus]|uniref:Uncharacterized protein n=1 Tax=Eleginops maclovinus TaxID=56733 RepID=A0AAN7XYL3_ELEMC|nr:hypothetical protein PBY51_009464 [Eleginops maclovinus]